MKYCPICQRTYEPKRGAEGMAVDCPYCWEGRTLVPQMGPMNPITNCQNCGVSLTPGAYGAVWGLCPSCTRKKEEK